MLPIPKDPNYSLSEVSEENFSNPQGEENEDLLNSAAWDDDEDDTDEEE